ncbi:hypothetical protein L915_17643 [Phytophthora nicotianae]|uniref:Uncharacterized protein n=1 Tax=Phytophthora nicotianae TaxID=4792 RepID=W2FYA3_PHYNI|nr:hypothetical protein L915_17643 [Phytophthora nicotianae]
MVPLLGEPYEELSARGHYEILAGGNCAVNRVLARERRPHRMCQSSAK